MKKAGQNSSDYIKDLYSFWSMKKQASQGQDDYTKVYIAVGRAEQAGQGLSGYTKAYTAAKRHISTQKWDCGINSVQNTEPGLITCWNGRFN